MKTAFLIPAQKVVRDPLSKEVLPKAGAEKPLNSYWKRRVQTGDVVIGKPYVEPKAVKTTTKIIKKGESK